MGVSRLVKSQLRLVLNNGINPDTGAAIFKTKSFNNLKTTANPEQLFSIAQAFAALQTLPLYSVERSDQSEITES